jgi:hypothetical protein
MPTSICSKFLYLFTSSQILYKISLLFFGIRISVLSSSGISVTSESVHTTTSVEDLDGIRVCSSCATVWKALLPCVGILPFVENILRKHLPKFYLEFI